ncbi:MAG: oligoendopeptidase F [Acidobacteriota bacterium]|jgi:oligoendopeptidase F|nr:oligoendopeptidase F [Acidobacteriota bacterium]
MQDAYVKERERSHIPERYRWDLGDIYPDDAAWAAAKKELLARLPEISSFAGTLGQSAERLFQCLDLVNLLRKEYMRLACYASMKSDEDVRDATCLAMDQEMSQVASDFSALSAFIEPEILRLGGEGRPEPVIDAFVAEEPRLVPYRHVFDDILRQKEHTRSEGEERIIAEAGLMADAPGSINGVFTNADFPYPEVTLANGATVRLDPAAFSLNRRSPVRADRAKVFEAYMGKMAEFRRTFGAQLAAEVRKNMFFARVRNYPSCLDRALGAHNIPTAVYTNLVAGIRGHLDTMCRYLDLRRRLLKLDDLHYYDLYAPIVAETDLAYTYDEAVDLVVQSLGPLGGGYVDVARKALTSRWVDVYHNDGKRSGAYSNGSVYDAHPYILLNYNGKYDDVSTIAHELGHTMHSHLANQAQPFALSHYSIFVAEVASTFNEALLLEFMLKNEVREEVRLSLLGNYLDNARATVFRQTQFAEFELKMHQLAEGGAALTGDLLDETYIALVREYYGHRGDGGGACVVDDVIRAEWAHIPHFFYNFYVYQYATSFIASAALAEKVMAGGREEAEGYLDLLRAGGSDYPIDLLKKAGVDMTTTAPMDACMRRLNQAMDEIERLAAALGRLGE